MAGVSVRSQTIFFLLSTAPRDRQPPTANHRQPPPTIVEDCFCGIVSCPCLDHEAESVPVNICFCWRYEVTMFVNICQQVSTHVNSCRHVST